MMLLVIILTVFLFITWSLYYQQRLEDERIDDVSIYQNKERGVDQ